MSQYPLKPDEQEKHPATGFRKYAIQVAGY